MLRTRSDASEFRYRDSAITPFEKLKGIIAEGQYIGD